MTWWYWLLLGLVLAGAEMISPGGFYLLFFGIAALIIGALSGLALVQAQWLEWFLFSILAIVSLLLFRQPLLRMTKTLPNQAIDSMIGESAVVLDTLPPGQTGKAELRGTTWNVRTDGTTPLAKGQRATVTKVDGLTIWVTPESR